MTLSLFARELQVVVLASGSKGNCTYIGDGQAGVLVDCGISAKQVLLRMDAAGLSDAPIDGVLITHEHSDHVGGARVLAKRLRVRSGRAVPFYMTAGTRGRTKPGATPDAIEEISPNTPFSIRHLRVDPFAIPHDTADPVAYRVGSGGTWAGVITDLGRPTALVSEKLRSLSVAVLEFNHDMEMLLAGPYPWQLKQRIKSSHGHLSNRQAAGLLSGALSDGLRHVALAHLSDENNAPARALAAAAMALRDADAQDRVTVRVALQSSPSRPMCVPVSDW